MENASKALIIAGAILLAIAIIGVGMYVFRHKTQKVQFVIGFPLITILEIITVIYFIFK